MKKTIFITAIIICSITFRIFAQCGGGPTIITPATSIGMIIYSNDIETVWNALRFANFSRDKGDTVNIFLLGKGVELDDLVRSDSSITRQANIFLQAGGTILGCGTCLQSRKNNTPQVCKFSSMGDLYLLVRKNKIVMTF
jgi:hypothetical protein